MQADASISTEVSFHHCIIKFKDHCTGLTMVRTSFFARVLAEVACVVYFLSGDLKRNESLTNVLLCDQLGTCMRLHLHLRVQPQRACVY